VGSGKKVCSVWNKVGLKYPTLLSLPYAMTEQTVAMYLLTLTRPTWTPAPDLRQHLSDAQVLTTALVAAI
jgi:hypothetical protein